jgi:peroxiredoxin
MKTDKVLTQNQGRLQQLQEKFRLLEPTIDDSHTKQALSILYGMIQETWRQMNTNQPQSGDAGTRFMEDITNLYRSAPKMQGSAMNNPLPVGIKAPDFELRDAGGKTVKLSDYRGQTVLLVFYPLDWSPGCSQQLDLYQSEFEEFEKRNVKVLCISVDSIYSHGAWTAVRNLKFPLLSDFNPKGEVAVKYQVYRDSDGFSERALYIIDGNGIIQYSYISPYLHHVPDVSELYAKLDETTKPVMSR